MSGECSAAAGMSGSEHTSTRKWLPCAAHGPAGGAVMSVSACAPSPGGNERISGYVHVYGRRWLVILRFCFKRVSLLKVVLFRCNFVIGKSIQIDLISKLKIIIFKCGNQLCLFL